MLDINFIRQYPEEVKSGLKRKGVDPKLVDKFLRLDEEWRAKTAALDQLKSEQNKVSAEIGKKKSAHGMSQAKLLKNRISEIKSEYDEIDAKRNEVLALLPNLPAPEVPTGEGEKDNKVVREVGEKPTFDFKPKDHLELGEALGILDFEAGAKVAGSGFYYLKNDGVLLELALVRYALDFLAEHGFSLWFTPDLAREKFYLGTGYSPRGPEAQTYEIKDSDLGLIATSEISLAGIHSDETLIETDLPRFYAGYSHCFRQEAGGYGKYSKGLYRVHQFTKVEMFAFTKPEDSPEVHRMLLEMEEKLWQGLGIPYRVVEMCTGDLGAQAARKFDLEAWMPGRGDYGEITSTSNTTDYQARRLNIKYRNGDGKSVFVHTLNGTAVATSRAIVAILENYQTKQGTIRVPKILRDYVGKLEIG
ncbi:MAG TPA: serine--tRNA ligase [Candidatus Paceibacterota bacterium]|nr:serine--tRNA ligase [Candidatus Paceibacterota bacterium]